VMSFRFFVCTNVFHFAIIFKHTFPFLSFILLPFLCCAIVVLTNHARTLT
jgi:hypothetical protein